MLLEDIVRIRLFNHHLTGEKLKTPQDVVRHLGAVQSQDFAAATWSIGQRMQQPAIDDVENEYNKAAIVRTHIMRPTWHFVLPENVVWMQELTRHRVKQLMNTYNKKLELTDDVFATCNKAIMKALRGNTFLTRQELKKILEEIGIKTDVQRLAHIIMWAELDCLIINGPRRGKQFTYALVEERIPKVKILPHDESLAKLMLIYFQSHGPAQLKDFSWWSGLTLKETEEGLSTVRSQLREEMAENKTYWFSKTAPSTYKLPPTSCHIVSIYDEYTIAYKDRSALGAEHYVEKFISMGNALTAPVMLDGYIAGTWKRIMRKKDVDVFIKMLRTLTKEEKESIAKEVDQYGKFLNMQCNLSFQK